MAAIILHRGAIRGPCPNWEGWTGYPSQLGHGVERRHGPQGDQLEMVSNRGVGEIDVINEARPGKMPTDLEPPG